MRLIRLIPAALILLSPVCAFAQTPSIFAPGQEATDYVNKTDYFSVNFPTAPKTQEITYPSEYRITLPGRVYSSDAGRNHYSVTVIDYRDAIKIHEARNAKCMEDAGANRPGLTPQQRRDAVGDSCQDDGPEEMHGAIMFATYPGGVKRTLSNDDINGVCDIYPTGAPRPDGGTGATSSFAPPTASLSLMSSKGTGLSARSRSTLRTEAKLSDMESSM
jgi:hypothetical protein